MVGLLWRLGFRVVSSLGLGFRAWGVGLKGFRISGLTARFQIKGSFCLVSLGFKISISGFRASVVEFRIRGVGTDDLK